MFRISFRCRDPNVEPSLAGVNIAPSTQYFLLILKHYRAEYSTAILWKILKRSKDMSGEHEHGPEGCCGGHGGHDDGHECGCQGEKKQKAAAVPAKLEEKGCGCGGHGHDHAGGHRHHHGEGGCCGGH
jgi:hypothetical protein